MTMMMILPGQDDDDDITQPKRNLLGKLVGRI
jgi:hypothetical protein